MEFTLRVTFNTSSSIVYDTWLNSNGHSQMTGGEARITHHVGDSFEAWDGYIWGINLELDPKTRILQSWRTADFTDGQDDSLVEITLTDVNGKCELVLRHSHLQEEDSHYIQGWKEHYFAPMEAYFSQLAKD